MPSLLEALEQKYGESSTESEGSDEDEGIAVAIFVPCKSPRTIVPSLLVLNDCDIATAGEKDALVAKCASVEELDLAKNKLNDWPEVFGILQQMPRLKFVNLSFNVLSTPLIDVDRNMQWCQLKNLVLNSTYIDWESVQRMLQHLPGLEELHLSLNDYNSVNLYGNIVADNEPDALECCYQCGKLRQNARRRKKHCSYAPNTNRKHNGIRRFHFTGNPVEFWMEIAKLGFAFPNLESLVLAECPIKSLDPLDDPILCQCRHTNEEDPFKTDAHETFRKLRFLNLNSTMLATWDDIDRLAKFPALHSVRVQGCPLWDTNEYTEHERRQLVIARLPNVKMLNGGGTISADERETSERAFIRYYMEKPESDRPERFLELIAIHGKLDPLVNVDLRPEKRVKVTFTCGTNSEMRSVDVYRTVSDLKTKLEPFAGFSAAKMRLFYVDQDLRDIQGPEEMKYPHKQLYSYNIRSGDEIIIDSKRKITSSISNS